MTRYKLKKNEQMSQYLHALQLVLMMIWFDNFS